MQNVKHRETISRTVEVEFTHKKIIGGGGEFAKVRIRLAPLPPEMGVQFVNEVPEGNLPDDLIEGARDGIVEAAKSGVLNGGSVVGFKASLLDGWHHEIDSNRRTFSLAAQDAFWDAMRKAGPKLLLT